MLVIDNMLHVFGEKLILGYLLLDLTIKLWLFEVHRWICYILQANKANSLISESPNGCGEFPSFGILWMIPSHIFLDCSTTVNI